MAFSIPFGTRKISFTLPDSCRVQEMKPRSRSPIFSVEDTLNELLDCPTHGPALKDRVDALDRIAIICDDHTRPTPIRDLLSPLLDLLLGFGISRRHIDIYIAYGLHPPMKKHELENRFGKEIIRNFSICHHDAHQKETLAFLGNTSFETPVYVNRGVMDADFRIGMGNISLSKEAGYGGGAKILMPGVCGAETIYGSHGKVRFHPNQIGCISGNPIREEIEEVGRMAHLDFIVNTILNEDDEICRLVAGDPLGAFREGVRLFNQVYQFTVKKPFDWCLAGSSPYDFEFYQANKAISAAGLGVKDGGAIVLVSPCHKGISAFPYFDEMVTSGRDFAYWREALGKPDCQHKVAGEICLSLRYLMDVRKITVGMVSTGISKEKIAQMGLKPYGDMNEAIADNLKRHGMNAAVGTLPKAPMTLLDVS
jgi:nickel-dependent lactate racemase